MIDRLRKLGAVALLAATLAVVGFAAAGYGVFGAVPATNAILETTAQSPLDVLPRPSPAIDAGGAVAPAQPSTAQPTAAVVLLGVIGVAAIAIWLRIWRPRGRARESGGDPV